MAFTVILSAIGGNAAGVLIGRDLVEQLEQHGRVTQVAAGELDGPDLQCLLIDPEADLAPDAALGPTMLTRVPLSFTGRHHLAVSASAMLASMARAQLSGTNSMPHIVLLGDSVFDNAPYVAAGQEVMEKLRHRLPAGSQATLLARDGAMLAGVREQTQQVPADATHLFISAGGNDGLSWTGIFSESAASVAEALVKLAGIRREFQHRYRAMLDDVLRLERPTTVCTIYDVRFPDPAFREVALTALTLLNDVITREAGSRGLPLLDLRTLFDQDADFANPIEPSAQGGVKLAQAILQVVNECDFSQPRSTIFTAAEPH